MNDSGSSGADLIILIAIILIVIAVILSVISWVYLPLFTQDSVILTVTKTDTYTSTSCSSDSDGDTSCSTTLHNLVYTDKEIVQFNDCLVLWVWGSQTQFSHLEAGKMYKFKVYGWNVPWLNWYRSVISYQEV